jgi:Exostosin family
MGLSPPPINPLRLSHSERTSVMETCVHDVSLNRSYFFSCVGQARTPLRVELYKHHNLTKGIILMDRDHFVQTLGRNITYEELLQRSIFAAAPRGDNRFSYRFTEVLSAGAIPVVHSDDWVLPFRKEFVDWPKECAIVIPETDVNHALEILSAISPVERCYRRRRCYEIYIKYMANPEGTIAGILESAALAIVSIQNKSGLSVIK